MFTPILDSSQRRPLYEQLYRSLPAEMRTGAISAGTRMPSKRRPESACPPSGRWQPT